jgi:hypothetical protein
MSLAGSMVVCTRDGLTYGVDPRDQSTSKDLAYRWRTLMLYGGTTFVTFLGRGFG